MVVRRLLELRTFLRVVIDRTIELLFLFLSVRPLAFFYLKVKGDERRVSSSSFSSWNGPNRFSPKGNYSTQRRRRRQQQQQGHDTFTVGVKRQLRWSEHLPSPFFIYTSFPPSTRWSIAFSCVCGFVLPRRYLYSFIRNKSGR